jgi:predicted transcriptional regulator
MQSTTLQIEVPYFPSVSRRMKEQLINPSALAQAAGVAFSQLSRWLHKDIDPKLSSIVKIEHAFETIAELRK